MATRVRFLGVAAYEIVSPCHRILIDPFLTGNPGAPCGPDDVETPDVILVTHAAPDHLGDAFAIAKRTGAPVVCGADVRALLLSQGLPSEQVRATVWGIVVEVGGVVVRPVECRHWSMATLPNGQVMSGVPLAFIVEPEEGVRIYH
ncbi:MAG TPA: MBL fold metallo-hydrolase, partial [Chloroflexota bacterium]|nr:MBL fold metallo-hydrolase [Chloroflexota bacterium]